MLHPKIEVVDEHGNELEPKQVEFQEDEEGIYAIRIVLNSSDLSGARTFGT